VIQESKNQPAKQSWSAFRHGHMRRACCRHKFLSSASRHRMLYDETVKCSSAGIGNVGLGELVGRNIYFSRSESSGVDAADGDGKILEYNARSL
jgi:hypothetical protein